ncbi:MAG TPA: hypothetical protein VF629_04770 [Hymenobacter sp.]|jgi:hypothetical protein|uniref:hypothetical protein n=1 Tax=Hymenobacter sp. TaxID=1898978 RepID=UPI002ED9C229
MALLSPPVAPVFGVLAPPALPANQVCTVTVQTFHHLGNTAYENTAETVFEKTLLRAGSEGHVFRLLVRSFTQTNTSGLNRLDEDMTKLKEELVVETDEAGRLRRVLNKSQLKQRFEELRPSMLRKYTDAPFITPGIINNIGLVLEGDGYLEDVLNASPEYSLLFPGLYGRAYTATPAPLGRRLIPRVLGNLDLPLLTAAARTESVPAGVAYGVYVTGQVNEAEFRADDLQQATRAITDQFDLDATLRARHQESYEFDDRHELLFGAQLTDYRVPGVFSTQVVSTLKTAALPSLQ